MCRINNFYICYIFFILQLTKVIKNTDYKKINNNNIHFIIEIELLTKTLPNVRYKHKYISHFFCRRKSIVLKSNQHFYAECYYILTNIKKNVY